jgi:Ca2+-transporting ATPase
VSRTARVELTIPGRQYKVSGSGYSTDGRIKHVAGDPDIPLEPAMFRLALACDGVLTSTGEMISDPTEGALVELAEKAGWICRRPASATRASPSCRSTPPTS